MQRRIIFDITPIPWLKMWPSWTKTLRIPEECFYLEDESRWMTSDEKIACGYKPVGCKEWRETGLCDHSLSKQGRYFKRKIERYNEYKDSLLTLAKRQFFSLPPFGFAVYFYFPVPAYWSKAKKSRMHGQMKFSKPDTTNLVKAFEDSLSITDEKVTQLSGSGKFWVNQERGYIEVLINQPIYNPFDVMWIDQDMEMKQPKRKYMRHGQTVGKSGKSKQRKLFREDKELF